MSSTNASLQPHKSHSVWSAWIEIRSNFGCAKVYWVALRLECVDRNMRGLYAGRKPKRRTPFGVRG